VKIRNEDEARAEDGETVSEPSCARVLPASRVRQQKHAGASRVGAALARLLPDEVCGEVGDIDLLLPQRVLEAEVPVESA